MVAFSKGGLIYKPNAWYNNWIFQRLVAILVVIGLTFVIIFVSTYESGDTTVLRMLSKNNEVIVVQVVHRSIVRHRSFTRSLCDFIQTCEPAREFYLTESGKINYGQVRSDHNVTIGGGTSWFVSLIYSDKPLGDNGNVTFSRGVKPFDF